MFKYLLENRQGQFLLLGTIALIAGFATSQYDLVSRILFYASIFFLGFYAAQNAVVDTIQSKKLNVDLLMVLAALGAVIINYESEGALLLFIFALAEVMEKYVTSKSTSAIEELMGQVPDTAQRLRADGEVETVSTDDLKVGDTVVVARGGQLPIDGIVDRIANINEAALTGESVPITKHKGDEVFAGTINMGDAFHISVSKDSSETVFSNIIRMVEEAQNRPSRTAKFIDRFESKYVAGVLISVPIFIALLYYVNGLPFNEAFYRGMVMLTVASPCALVAAATPATLAAISNGARNGILVKGGAALEALEKVDVLYTDKTGTLTEGDFAVVDYQLTDRYINEIVYMEQQSTHPIAEAIVDHFMDADFSQIDHLEVQEIAGSGLKKGDIRVGKPSSFKDFQDPNGYLENFPAGTTTIMIADGNKVVGRVSLADNVRLEAEYAVAGFLEEGIDVVLLTGDNEEVASAVANEVGIKHYHAGLLPEDKIKFVMEDQDAGKVVGMVGDGINDAPALVSADIGVGMGSGSSVAMESSDIVMVQNDLSKLLHAYRISKKLNTIIKQNVTFSIGVIVLLVILNLLGLLGLPMAVVFHEGSTILVILNGLRMLAVKNQMTPPTTGESIEGTSKV